MTMSSRTLVAAAVAGVLFASLGCGRPAGTVTAQHGHNPGSHGGLLVSIGGDACHAEAVFEKDGVLRFYTLGRDETRVVEVEAEVLPAFVRAEGETEAAPFVLKPEPQPGDTPGRTSQFVGKLPREAWGKSVEVTIPNLRVGGERFRVPPFKNTGAAHAAEAMPDKVADEAERTLYLTPGGKYTEADIRANGGKTASQKFKGFQAAHDLKPKVGDRICPVTLTKASPFCTWVVAGGEYQFCCPPCVDEFVQAAKDKPEELKPPEEYRKK